MKSPSRMAKSSPDGPRRRQCASRVREGATQRRTRVHGGGDGLLGERGAAECVERHVPERDGVRPHVARLEQQQRRGQPQQAPHDHERDADAPPHLRERLRDAHDADADHVAEREQARHAPVGSSRGRGAPLVLGLLQLRGAFGGRGLLRYARLALHVALGGRVQVTVAVVVSVLVFRVVPGRGSGAPWRRRRLQHPLSLSDARPRRSGSGSLASSPGGICADAEPGPAQPHQMMPETECPPPRRSLRGCARRPLHARRGGHGRGGPAFQTEDAQAPPQLLSLQRLDELAGRPAGFPSAIPTACGLFRSPEDGPRGAVRRPRGGLSSAREAEGPSEGVSGRDEVLGRRILSRSPGRTCGPPPPQLSPAAESARVEARGLGGSAWQPGSPHAPRKGGLEPVLGACRSVGPLRRTRLPRVG